MSAYEGEHMIFGLLGRNKLLRRAFGVIPNPNYSIRELTKFLWVLRGRVRLRKDLSNIQVHTLRNARHK
jgi:hypothetical protein